MENHDSLKRNDQVTVSIFGPDGSRIYSATQSGLHSIEAAVKEALSNAGLQINPEDCVFEVTNLTAGVSHRYRLNAHGNIKLIV